jgi:hypothetical protein
MGWFRQFRQVRCSENSKENDPQPSRSVEADLDFRIRLAASSDVSEHKLADTTLRFIAEGTAAATGNEFSRSLARCAAQALGARDAFCRRNAQRDEVAIPGLLGRFGFWRGVHLSFFGKALPAGRGRSHLRDFIGLAGEILRGPLAAADRRRELYRYARCGTRRVERSALGGVAPGAHGTVGEAGMTTQTVKAKAPALQVG